MKVNSKASCWWRQLRIQSAWFTHDARLDDETERHTRNLWAAPQRGSCIGNQRIIIALSPSAVIETAKLILIALCRLEAILRGMSIPSPVLYLLTHNPTEDKGPQCQVVRYQSTSSRNIWRKPSGRSSCWSNRVPVTAAWRADFAPSPVKSFSFTAGITIRGRIRCRLRSKTCRLWTQPNWFIGRPRPLDSPTLKPPISEPPKRPQINGQTLILLNRGW